MRRVTFALALTLLTAPLFAQSIRGPVAANLAVTPTRESEAAELGLDEIVLLRADGDFRFYDALELEILTPETATAFPGALTVIVSTTGTYSERAGVAEINGAILVSEPIVRAGRTFFYVPLREGAETNASAVARIIPRVLAGDFPLVVTLVSAMKGLPQEIAESRITITASPVTRDIGAAAVSFRYEDGSTFPADGLRSPPFSLEIDGRRTSVSGEYLLEPGIHRFSLISEEYLDQLVTVAVEPGATTLVEIPLLPALATIAFSAPRGARVYIDGQDMGVESGDFTAVPGEHTIVVVVGDYTVTRRFSVEEGRSYSLSVTMDLVVEETK
jgi:hypothetical protein